MLHPRVRHTLVAMALSVIAIDASAAEPNFEGQITYKMKGGEQKLFSIAKNVLRMESSSHPGGMVVVMNFEARKMLMIIPPLKRYSEGQLPDLSAENVRRPLKVKKLGKTEIVAGVKCELWNIDNDGRAADACIASGMGTFEAWSGSVSQASFGQVLRQIGGGLMLKVSGPDMQMEATKVERKQIDPSLFQPPAGYQKMQSAVPLPHP